MPANLTPQYLSAEQRFKEAVTTREKIEALEEMMAVIPKHKGTEKMQADLRRRLARLRSEAERKHGAAKGAALYTVPREGAGQVVLVGAPNVGKSSLLQRLTHAQPEIGDYPFTTRLPQPGMMPYEDVQVQLVDMPPVSRDFYEPWIGGIVRQADMLLLVVDAGSDELLDEVEDVIEVLGGSRIVLRGKEAAETAPGDQSAVLRTLLVANKCDAPGANENVRILHEFYDGRYEIFPSSASTGVGLEALRHIIFERLDVVRVYTKVPGRKADLSGAPYVLKRGSTVLDAAQAVHRDFAHSLKFARVWSSEGSGRSVRFEGQMVERSHRLEDGDIIELHG